MTTEKSESLIPRARRQFFLLKAPKALAIALIAMLALATAALVYLLKLWWVPPETLDVMGSATAMRLAIWVNVTSFLFLLGALLATAILMTQRVAFPAMVIERAIKGMQEGDFRRRLKLRRADYLKPLAATAAELQSHLAQQHAAKIRFRVALKEACEAEDLEAVASLTESMWSAGTSSGVEDLVADLQQQL